MADIFSAQPGKVVAVTGNGLPMQIVIGNPAIGGLPESYFRSADVSSYSRLRAIIQHLGVGGQSGAQFMHTLADFIYVYVFGERLGQLNVGGLAFHSACGDPDSAGDAVTGFEQILNYYKNFRITTYPLSLTVVIGTTVAFDAFLVSVQGDLVNPETNLAQFQMQLAYIPNQADLLPDEES